MEGRRERTESERELERKRRREQAVKKRRKLIAAMVLCLALVVLAIVFVLRSCGNTSENSEDKGTTEENITTEDSPSENEGEVQLDLGNGVGLVIEYEEPAMQELSFTVSLVGDCTLGTDTSYGTSGSFIEEYSLQTPDYFFAGVSDAFDNDDLTVVNLEGPLTDSTNKQDKTFAFKGDEEFTEILTEGSIEAVNLANNHSYDYGTEGFEDTQNAVTAAGVTWFGYDETPVVEVNGIQVGLVGVYMLRLTDDQGKEALETRIQQAEDAGAEVIIVSFHWGSEYSYYPSASQEMLAKYAIDLGADLVVGHHPHVLQGIDLYEGKYIVYSLGNFCFGGNRNPSDKDTIIFQQTFTVQNSEVEVNDDINIIPCSLSSVTTRNDYQPTILSGDAKDEVADKLQDISMIDIMPYISE
ncbi:MAG: CapA family protein [Eubacteriales bacterium]